MNSSFNDKLLSDEDILQLEFETKLDFARTFGELYLLPLETALGKLLTKKGLVTIKHLGHKIGGHAEFPKLLPLGESLERHAKKMLKKNLADITVFHTIFSEIMKIYKTEIIPFLNENEK